MKKLISLTLVLVVLLGSLTACNFTQNLSGAIAGEAEATPKVEQMMLALAEDRAADAKAFMHPQTADASDGAIAQMSAYLSGRKVSTMELTSINVNTSTGTAGTTRQERVNYQVTLQDGDVICLNVLYLSNNQGTGFASFQLVLGAV
ncbi:MAG: hypothetical protein IJO28_06125 [Oscillospiraceae bacterium]|nr:hypothetical protein [Oscillospiraceae bacterium]